MNIVALIPARGGSKRIPRKNIKLLGGKPLIQWTIDAALEADIFNQIVVSTDDAETADIAGRFAVMRPEVTGDNSPDIWWVQHAMERFKSQQHWTPDAFAILRPTSPFRTADTIHRAFRRFELTPCSSIRAVEPAKQHPAKMWQENGPTIEPLVEKRWWYPNNLPFAHGSTPFHSQPTQSLPKVYVQNSSLEMAWTWCVTVFDSISGPKVAPFFTEGMEGFSIDYPEDWDRAERYVADLQTTPAAQ